MYIAKKDRTVENKLYQRLRRVHYGMIQRCYNKKSTGYKNYGAKGVYVSPEWIDFEGFLATVDTVPGWDASRYLVDKLSLDKDVVWGNKLYSPKTCQFVTPKENNKRKPNQQRWLVGLSPVRTLHVFNSAHDFAESRNLSYNNILNCAKGTALQAKGWQFRFADDYMDIPFINLVDTQPVLVGLSPSGVTYTFTNASAFAREHGLIGATVIYACANGKNMHSHLWQFRFRKDIANRPFLPASELNIVGKRGRQVKAVSPDGVVYYTNNRSAFAREHKLNRNAIHKVLQGEISDYKGWVFTFE